MNPKEFPIENEFDFVLNGFFPLAVLARICGYFPFSNMCGKNVKHANELRILKFRPDLFVFITACVGLLFFNFLHLSTFFTMPSSDFRFIVIKTSFSLYWFFCIVFFVHFAIIKRSRILTLFKNFTVIQRDILQAKRRKQAKTVAYLLALSILLTSLTYSIGGLMVNKLLSLQLKKAYFMLADITLCTIYHVNLFSYGFTSSILIYFTCCLKWSFEDLSTQLNQVVKLSDEYSDWEMARRLSKIKERHEILVTTVDQLNSLLSPILGLYIVAQSVANCVNTYELIVFILRDEGFNTTLKNILAIAIRLIPLIFVCVSSSALKTTADLIDCPMNKYSFLELGKKSKFQVEILWHQFSRRKAKITANDIFTVDNRLLAEIFGVTLTYIVIMLEVSNERSTSSFN